MIWQRLYGITDEQWDALLDAVRYDGPDAREMAPEQAQHHLTRWQHFMDGK